MYLKLLIWNVWIILIGMIQLSLSTVVIKDQQPSQQQQQPFVPINNMLPMQMKGSPESNSNTSPHPTNGNDATTTGSSIQMRNPDPQQRHPHSSPPHHRPQQPFGYPASFAGWFPQAQAPQRPQRPQRPYFNPQNARVEFVPLGVLLFSG